MTRYVKRLTLPDETVLVVAHCESPAESRALKKAGFRWVPVRKWAEASHAVRTFVGVSVPQALAPRLELHAHVAQRLATARAHEPGRHGTFAVRVLTRDEGTV